MDTKASRDLIRLLIIEDSEDDTELLVRQLRKTGLAVEFTRVESELGLREALAQPWDAIISDFQMPQFDGMQAFQIVKEAQSAAPFIFVSGVLGEERAVAAMRAGAKDYVLKGNLERIGPALRRELEEAENRREHAVLARTLATTERRFQSIFESAAIALVEVDFSAARRHLVDQRGPLSAEALDEASKKTRILAANGAALSIFDAGDLDQLVGAIGNLFTTGESRKAWREVVTAVRSDQVHFQREVQFHSLSGRAFAALVACRAPRTDEESLNVVLSLLDVSERNSLERQMRAAQRMEAVAGLAGGMAHDFNNMLAVISSYTGFLLESDLSQGQRDDVSIIEDAATRAAGLTRQLLAFSRRQFSAPRTIDINAIVAPLEEMLQRLIGEDIEVTLRLAPDLRPVKIDPSHVEQIVMNLVVNARDAMAGGGRLLICSENVTLDERYSDSKPVSIPPGPYVRISITDDGAGMDEETRLQIFEPFFTTKESGRGTGLGLSTVHGIVRQADGFIWVYSELEIGTTFKIYLPASTAAPEEVAHEKKRRKRTTRTGTVLLCEDQAPLRKAISRMLGEVGYSVLVAADAEIALELARDETVGIDVLLTDVVLPGMSGSMLADELGKVRPSIRVLFMSGFAGDAVVEGGLLSPDRAFVEKPFTIDRLLGALGDLLESG